MHTLSRGRTKAATPGLARPHGRKRRPTPMVWRAGARHRHATRSFIPARLLLLAAVVCAVILMLTELPWI